MKLNLNYEEIPKEVAAKVPKLISGVLSDIMDRMGFWNQTMHHSIQALDGKMKVFGRARTVLAVEVYEVPKEPYKLMIEAVDDLKEGDVLVAQSGCERAGFWGELLSNASVGHKANGVVVDGYTRDVDGILELGFPVFVKGTTPADSRGRLDVIARDVPIVCGGVRINSGDFVFGDVDGVVAIPKEHVVEVINSAYEKVVQETNVREELIAGVSVAEVFSKYGIL